MEEVEKLLRAQIIPVARLMAQRDDCGFRGAYLFSAACNFAMWLTQSCETVPEAMDDDNYDRHFRLLICGGKGTGKSSILSCFSFEGDRLEGTTVLRLDDVNIRIDVRKKDEWQREYVSEFDAVVVVFAADDFKSFEYAVEVLRSVQSCDFLPVVIIENKIDLIDEYDFSNKDVIENSIKQSRIRLYRVSAKHDFNVMHPFAYVLEKLLRYSDENANVDEKSGFRLGRSSSREGWIEPSTSSSRKKNTSCSIM